MAHLSGSTWGKTCSGRLELNVKEIAAVHYKSLPHGVLPESGAPGHNFSLLIPLSANLMFLAFGPPGHKIGSESEE